MALRKAKEFRDQSAEELRANLLDARKELFAVKNEKRQAKRLEKPHTPRHLKKEIARMLTVITQKEHAQTK